MWTRHYILNTADNDNGKKLEGRISHLRGS